jgi:hypothetical protein
MESISILQKDLYVFKRYLIALFLINVADMSTF